jgi:hypothetical protein
VFLSIPGIPIKVGGADVLQLDKAGARDVLGAFGAQPPSTTTTRPSVGATATTAPAPPTSPPTTEPAVGSDPSKLC